MSSKQQPPANASRSTQPKLLDQVRNLCRTQHLSVRTIQELLGHKDLSTTMVYTHVGYVGPSGVVSPLDRL